MARVYCLVRSTSPEKASLRVTSAFRERSIPICKTYESKVVTLPSDISKEGLGLRPEVLEEMKNQVSLIIHSAWAVNFNLGLRSFEVHIQGAQKLINLSLSVRKPSPARFIACSSISTAFGMPRPATVLEGPLDDLAFAQSTGYARSKLVMENIVCNAVHAGADCRILRIGQIVGDSKMGLWNTSEAIPLMIRTAVTLGCLPCLDEGCSWLPVDSVADIVLEIAGVSNNSCEATVSQSNAPWHVYNVVNPRIFSWTSDLLPALRNAGLTFETLPPQEWVRRIQTGDQDPRRNPPVKLSSFFARRYGGEGKTDQGELRFSTERTEEASPTLKRAPDLIRDGYIDRFVLAWRREWDESSDGLASDIHI